MPLPFLPAGFRNKGAAWGAGGDRRTGFAACYFTCVSIKAAAFNFFQPLKRLQGGWQMLYSPFASFPPSPLFLGQLPLFSQHPPSHWGQVPRLWLCSTAHTELLLARAGPEPPHRRCSVQGATQKSLHPANAILVQIIPLARGVTCPRLPPCPNTGLLVSPVVHAPIHLNIPSAPPWHTQAP